MATLPATDWCCLGYVELKFLADHRSAQPGGGPAQGDKVARQPLVKVSSTPPHPHGNAGSDVHGRLNPYAQLWGLDRLPAGWRKRIGFLSGAQKT